MALKCKWQNHGNLEPANAEYSVKVGQKKIIQWNKSSDQAFFAQGMWVDIVEKIINWDHERSSFISFLVCSNMNIYINKLSLPNLVWVIIVY